LENPPPPSSSSQNFGLWGREHFGYGVSTAKVVGKSQIFHFAAGQNTINLSGFAEIEKMFVFVAFVGKFQKFSLRG
jgi:hypothetical protein